jgi:PRTRC genetic system protein F
VPAFHPDVPGELVIRRGGRNLVDVAEAFLDAGLLGDDDWMGDLASTVHVGIDRMINPQQQEEIDMYFIEIACSFTDCIGEWNLPPDHYVYHRADPGYRGEDAELPVGAFALRINATYTEVCCEEGVRRWEKRRRGLGFGLMRLVAAALGSTIGCVSPWWARNFLENSLLGEEYPDYDDDDDDDDLEDARMTSARLQKLLPKKIWEQCWSNESARIALNSRRRYPLSDMERQVLEAALKLEPLVLAAENGDNGYENEVDGIFDEMEQDYPIALRWNERDEIDRPSDQYHEVNANAGTASDIVFLQCFRAGAKEDLSRAIRNMQRAVEILRLTDVVMCGLETSNRLLDVYGREGVLYANRERVRV